VSVRSAVMFSGGLVVSMAVIAQHGIFLDDLLFTSILGCSRCYQTQKLMNHCSSYGHRRDLISRLVVVLSTKAHKEDVVQKGSEFFLKNADKQYPTSEHVALSRLARLWSENDTVAVRVEQLPTHVEIIRKARFMRWCKCA